MAKEFNIPELGVAAHFGKGEQLRYPSKVNLWDLISAGEEYGKTPFTVLKIVARQLHMMKQGSHRHDEKYDWSKLFEIYNKREGLPFVVAQTSLAIIHFDLNIGISAHPFVEPTKKVTYRPSNEILNIYPDEYIERIANGPARLAGSVLVTYYDGIDENTVLLGRRTGGYYDGQYTIPGGHADWPTDAFALHEIIEETGIEKSLVKNAEPIGVADQLILARGDTDNPSLTRYLNFMWEVGVYTRFDDRLGPAEEKGWRMFDDDEIPVKQLTPVARIAIDLSGFPMWNPGKIPV